MLLLKDGGLVKSISFKNHKYIGDPINAVRIFNDLEADELVFIDINASAENRLISLDFVREVGEEANMPFAVGGGIRTIEDIRNVLKAGAEKVILNTVAIQDQEFIKQACEEFGSSTIAICMDVKKKRFGSVQVWTDQGKKSTGMKPIEFAKRMEQCGAGEIIVQSIDDDGKMEGYNLELIKSVSEAVTIPVVALGGAGNLQDLQLAYTQGFAQGLAAGSIFIYHDKNRGVLINYPKKSELNFKS